MPSIAAAAFIPILVFVCLTDLRSRRIPNQAMALATSIAVAGLLISDPATLPAALLAATVVSIPLLIASVLRPEGMGMGDVKLMAVIGLFVGWLALPVLLAGLFLATFAGMFIALAERKPMGEVALPLAPFLSAAALAPLINLL